MGKAQCFCCFLLSERGGSPSPHGWGAEGRRERSSGPSPAGGTSLPSAKARGFVGGPARHRGSKKRMGGRGAVRGPALLALWFMLERLMMAGMGTCVAESRGWRGVVC